MYIHVYAKKSESEGRDVLGNFIHHPPSTPPPGKLTASLCIMIDGAHGGENHPCLVALSKSARGEAGDIRVTAIARANSPFSSGVVCSNPPSLRGP